MSNVHYTQFLKTIEHVYDEVKSKGVICLENQSDLSGGQFLNVDNEELINFGSCGYMGLETDERLIQKATEFIFKYGTQFAISRTFMIQDLHRQLESKLSLMFDGSKVLTYTSTSLAHISVLPIVVNPKDTIILDKQVHFSVQNAVQLLKSKGVPIRMVKHSNMEMMEQYIKRIKDKCERIWYMADGVYSMFGDIVPIEELNELMTKYEQLHLYVDDAHGVAWCGKNGSGSVFDKIKYKERAILSTTMGKAFGSIGGMSVFNNDEFYNRVLKFGGPLSYSHPLPPSIIGSAMAAADILTSPEGVEMQLELKRKIDYCNELMNEANLPIISNPESTIKFLCVGDLEMGYTLNKKMINEGYYVNLALFPAVSMNNTGMRFSLNRHIGMEHIKRFVELLRYHYFTTLKENNTTMEKVLKAFKLPVVKV